MELSRKKARGQEGFTLIEIIAVLVILGILAAVAVPKYLDLQADAGKKAVSGALASVASRASLEYAQAVLSDPANATGWATNVAGVFAGDFTGAYTVANGKVTASLTSGAPGWFANVADTAKSSSFMIYESASGTGS